MKMTKIANQFIHGRCRNKTSNEWETFTAVYASPQIEKKKLLWEKLRQLDPGNGIPWISGGDFHAILHRDERRGGSGISKIFVDFAFDTGLQDIIFRGSETTKGTYRYVIQKVQDKLSGWKAKQPSLAGRITLAKAVLTTIPSYMMQSVELPHGVCTEIERLIRSDQATTPTFQVDTPGWIGKDDTRFTIKSAYDIQNEQQSTEEPVWKTIAKEALLTNKERYRRHLSADAKCMECNEDWEDVDHILRSCGTAKIIWTTLIKESWLTNFFSLNIKEWLHKNLANPTYFAQSDHEWDTLFGNINWNLWTRRNKRIFDPANMDNETIIERSRRMVEEGSRVIEPTKIIVNNRRQQEETTVEWIPPPSIWLKLQREN
ncbi:hypothetical protein F3Y22_tig00111542pilonHSYRG00042 [Hibiscus syriacus]|uniref:Reverse transcriptase zinc-binding domain-containing protein n=1 Tax=Hibiscus syriacus TaxID=106335 RepID=A0A6A2XLC3_HIBSY|nr:hypothetical protein F3Y22_tig00111542pilonHSYRG00042 [Hibiscus syriacus]